MPKKIPASGQKKFFLHVLVYLIANAIMWYFTYAGKEHEAFVYPWPIWITAAWGLMLVGHACLVWFSYEDKYDEIYEQQAGIKK